jgi:hyperosmotically inducible periplasmic protein
MRSATFSRTRSAVLTVAMVAALGACSQQRGEQSTIGQYFDDTAVTAKVKAELIKDDAVRGTDVKVETSGGIVQLSGFVGSEAARRRAEQLAKATAGVKSVRNDLSVQSTQQSAGQYIDDAAITAKVKAALLADNDVKGLAINVETSKGTVQLSGSAKSDSERQKAEQLAKAVEGVTAVQNRIALN